MPMHVAAWKRADSTTDECSVSKQCYLDVFKYLVDNKIDCSVNNNGVFFNITTMADARLHDIEQILKQPERKKEGRKDKWRMRIVIPMFT